MAHSVNRARAGRRRWWAHGLRSLSLTDVAKRAGLTRGALLNYFDDLDSLLVEAHRAGTERYCDLRDEAVAAQSSYAAKLRTAIDAGLRAVPTTP
ncbi:TetR/AcrR family transcriptional regulator [Rhodococcus opacus]|uniref:TetR/AcrR family transcriptional regulator n=1 Tax=Rhodococcus opacus TaxID=37919 RepID=UPI00247340CE|nr:TetR family transcriptional regulator [Rhodococcus opacus]MDH6292109.1 AcrR family transcriptional regulator [Rhodococcus opacus]